MSDELVLVDLSSIAYPIWHVSQSEPDPNHTSTGIVGRIRTLTADYPYAAICCDKGRSFRKDLASSYKATRPEFEAPLGHQMDLAKEQLAKDGYPIWAVDGFEADDLIASATARALETADLAVRIVSSDKDVLQLVGPRVTVVSASTGVVYEEVGVVAKFGVKPCQIGDYLTLCGDASDNIKGAKGIGPKRAAELLATFGSLEQLYHELHHSAFPGGAPMTPGLRTALLDFEPNVPLTQSLIALRTDVPIPFEDIAVERTIKELPPMAPMEETDDHADEISRTGGDTALTDRSAARSDSDAVTPDTPTTHPRAVNRGAELASTGLAPLVTDYERALDPRSMTEAITLSNHAFQARLFNGFGSPQAVLMVLLAGREFGMPAMTALRAFHIVEGRPTLAADAIRALILRSGKLAYFRCTERTAERATFVAKRGDDPEISLTYTIEEARTAGLVRPNSAWTKSSADMLVARASSKLARLIAPDLVHGLYSPEEFD